MADSVLLSVLDSAALGARLFIAGVLLLAALHKLSNALEFEGIVGQYKLLPKGTEAIAARLVPGVEVIAALALLFAAKTGAILAAGLLLAYAVAIGINLQRGRAHIDCGCGGDATPLSPALIVRNLLMTVLLGVVLMSAHTLPQTTSGVLLGGAFAVGLAALYVCYNQLQVNAGIYRRLWLGERVG